MTDSPGARFDITLELTSVDRLMVSKSLWFHHQTFGPHCCHHTSLSDSLAHWQLSQIVRRRRDLGRGIPLRPSARWLRERRALPGHEPHRAVQQYLVARPEQLHHRQLERQRRPGQRISPQPPCVFRVSVRRNSQGRPRMFKLTQHSDWKTLLES